MGRDPPSLKLPSSRCFDVTRRRVKSSREKAAAPELIFSSTNRKGSDKRSVMTSRPRKHWGRRAAVTLAILLLLPSLSLRATLVESIQSSVVSANSTGNAFDVTLTNTGPSSVSIAGFSFGLQANTTNLTFISATTGTTTAPYISAGNSVFGPNITLSTGSSPPSIVASDAALSSAFTLTALSTIGLGHVFFNAGPAGGLTTLTFQASNTNLLDANGSNIPIDVLGSGTVLVNGSAIPTPETGASSAFLLLLGLAALTLARGMMGKNRRREGA
jgi:MYXO-CTERM domain-containing protein